MKLISYLLSLFGIWQLIDVHSESFLFSMLAPLAFLFTFGAFLVFLMDSAMRQAGSNLTNNPNITEALNEVSDQDKTEPTAHPQQLEDMSAFAHDQDSGAASVRYNTPSQKK